MRETPRHWARDSTVLSQIGVQKIDADSGNCLKESMNYDILKDNRRKMRFFRYRPHPAGTGYRAAAARD